jgi:microcompartment protein CcmK/EutM
MRSSFFTVLWMAWLLAASAVASPFDLGPASRNLVLAPGFHHADLTLPIQPAAGGFDYRQIQVTSSAAWVTPQVDAVGQKVILKFTTAALATGSHTATLTATHGADTFAVTLTAASTALNVFKLLDDPHRSRMYGIQLNGILAGSLLVIDPLTASPVSSITVGKRPTGMAISDDGSELFVINCVDKTLSVIDLQTLKVSETIALPVFGNWGESSTTANVGVGAGGILYYTDGTWGPKLHVYNRSSQQVLQSLTVTANSFGFGDFALNASKTQLFGWAQYGWSAGYANSFLVSYAVSETGTLTAVENSSTAFQLNRDPLETPVLVATDGEKVFVKEVVVNTGALSSISRNYPSDVYSISPGGEIAVTNNAIYQYATGKKLLDLPVTTSIQGITSDYSRLVYFHPVSKQLATMDLLDLIGAEALGRVPYPADASSVLQPVSLSLASQPGANGYEVYLGSTYDEVDVATPGAHVFLGTTQVPSFSPIQGLTPGAIYYWRADIVFDGHVSKGSVHSFTVSPITTSASKVEVVTVQGHTDQRAIVQLRSGTPGIFWSASSDQPWVSFSTSTGTTPGELEVRLNAGNLEVGQHTALITVSGGTGALFTLPVHLRVEPLKLTHLKSDPLSSIIYAISEDTGRPGAKAYLLELDAATESMLRVVPAGTSVTDLAIHQADGRIYLPNWRTGSLLAYDKATLALEQTYPFSAFQGMGYGDNDIYRVAAGKAGRLVVEEQDQWVDLHIFDTVNGTKRGRIGLREGGGVFEPSGRYYYHGENNSSGAEIYKLDVTGDVMTEVTSIRVSSYSYYGSRVVVGTEDGKSVFWNGSHFNADLVEQWSMADEIYCASADGRLAFGETKIYDTSARQHILSMPVATRVSAFNSTTNKLVLQKGAWLHYYPLNFPVSFPAPVLSAGSSAATTTSLPVSWTENSLETGFILQYRPVGTPNWIQRSPSPAANAAALNLTGLQSAMDYEIRIQATSPVASSPWSDVLVMRTLDPPPPTVRISTGSGSKRYIYISFFSSQYPTSIILERAASQDGPWTVLETLPGDVGEYRDYSIRADVTYYYRAQAVRGAFSSYSEVRSAKLTIPTLRVSFHREVDGSVILQVSSSENFTYVLQRRLGTEGAWQDLQNYLYTGYVYTDTDVVPATTYQYRLKALPESLTDKTSNVVTVTTLPEAPPYTPQIFDFTNISASQISLSWSDVNRETGYRIERKHYQANQWILLATVDKDVTSYTDTDLVRGYFYEYRLIAFNSKGDSPPFATFYPVAAHDLRVRMEDDFDPDLDAEQWTSTSVTSSVNGGAGFNGSKALWFAHGGLRVAEARPVDASGHGFVEFSLRAGNGSRDGTAYWENSIYEDEIILECSSNGTAWHPLRTFDMVYPALSDWTDFSIPFTHLFRSKTMRFRWRQKSSSSYSAGPWALDNVRIRSWAQDDMTILPTYSKLVAAGTSTNLSVGVNQPAATFQWYKDGELVPEATLRTYLVASAEPSHGGSYTCVIRHGDEVLTTQPIMLGVVEMAVEGPVYTRVGENFSLGMRVYPAILEGDLSFAWTRIAEGDLAGIGTVSGELTSTLTVSGATALAESAYQCRVTYPTELITRTLDVGPYAVRLLRRPTIQPIPDMNVVSGSPVDIGLVVTDLPVFIQVRGLPKGLSYDADTRRIVGSTTGNKSYTITVDANNPIGAADQVSFQLNLVGFPAALAGTYSGVFLETDPDTAPALRHGAQIAFKITNKGAASGTVMIQGKNHRFVSKNVATVDDGAWARLEADFNGPDGSPLQVAVDIVGGAGFHEAVLETSSGEATQVLAQGQVVRNDWSRANPAPNAGLINIALQSQDFNVPKGAGFMNLKLTSQGTVTGKGRLADGQAVTSSTIMGIEGHIPLFVSLYRGTGSFGTLMTYEIGEASGTGWWGKDSQGESAKDRVYKNGIMRHPLTVSGGLYVRPPVNAPLFDSQVDVPSPASLMLTGARLEEPGITQVLSFTGKHQAVLPREKQLNPYGFTLKLKAATGAFTGKFKLEDPNPLKSGSLLRRTVSFQGSLIPGHERGYGYFLLPELPNPEIPRSSLSNTPIWSGRVELIPESAE